MKKIISVSRGEEFSILVDNEKYDQLSRFKWHVSKAGYAMRFTTRNGTRKTIYMHREVTGCPVVGKEIDHINRNKLDNQSMNLRVATRQLQNLNKDTKGAFWDKSCNRWRAYFKGKYLGRSEDFEEAQKMYITARNQFMKGLEIC